MTFPYHSPPDSQGRYKPQQQQQHMWSIHSVPPYTPHLEVDQRFTNASFQDLQPQHQSIPQHPYQHQQRQRLSSTFWDDEHTYVYQVEVEHPTGTFTTVSRREDNNMINGTKLLNVVGLSRGKRDGILKNEKDRVVIKVGAMSLKGVWYVSRVPLHSTLTLLGSHSIAPKPSPRSIKSLNTCILSLNQI